MEFLFYCKEAYLKGITPLNFDGHHLGEDQKKQAISLAQKDLEVFSGHLHEYQYYVDLRAAHTIIELRKVPMSLRRDCLEVIKRHAKGHVDLNADINRKVSQEERQWLKDNEWRFS